VAGLAGGEERTQPKLIDVAAVRLDVMDLGCRLYDVALKAPLTKGLCR
jgi:hypothetical protein